MLYSIWSTILLYIPTDKAGAKIEQKKKIWRAHLEGSEDWLYGYCIIMTDITTYSQMIPNF